MNTKDWGPKAWYFTHTIMANAPKKLNNEQQKHYKEFFLSMKDILPCKYCKESYKQFIIIYPIDNYLHSGYLLQWWWYNIHNLVNQKLNQKGIPFEKVIEKYDNIKAKK